MKRTKLSEYPEMLKITALHTPSALEVGLEVGKLYEVYWVSTDKDGKNTNFCLNKRGMGLVMISKDKFEFVEVKIEPKIV